MSHSDYLTVTLTVELNSSLTVGRFNCKCLTLTVSLCGSLYSDSLTVWQSLLWQSHCVAVLTLTVSLCGSPYSMPDLFTLTICQSCFSEISALSFSGCDILFYMVIICASSLLHYIFCDVCCWHLCYGQPSVKNSAIHHHNFSLSDTSQEVSPANWRQIRKLCQHPPPSPRLPELEVICRQSQARVSRTSHIPQTVIPDWES